MALGLREKETTDKQIISQPVSQSRLETINFIHDQARIDERLADALTIEQAQQSEGENELGERYPP